MKSAWGASRGAFYGASALLFAASSALTIAWGASMSAMGEMLMPGGWSMSMAWMRMPGQSWAEVAATFVGMWTVMMVAMMLPSLVPVLWRYQERAAAADESLPTWLTARVGASYFFVWALLGLVVFVTGAVLATLAMREPAIARVAPIAGGVVVVIAGALQLSHHKAHHLECWREQLSPDRMVPADTRTAWRDGIRLGIHCINCSLGPTAVLLVLGVMDLRAMVVIGAAISLERLAPVGEHVARVAGVVAVGAGLILM